MAENFFEVRRVRAAICLVQTPALLPHSLACFRCFFSGRTISVFSERSFQNYLKYTVKRLQGENSGNSEHSEHSEHREHIEHIEHIAHSEHSVHSEHCEQNEHNVFSMVGVLGYFQSGLR